ncbi:MAG: four helix bundle protein [Bacteroidota bacterium]|nr:four helix bundle protein [Bacteroidota bacterium]
MKSGNLIVDFSFHFALDIIVYSDLLDENRKYTLAKQILKAGTSVGANVKEAQFGESTNDFIHKLKIAEKEAEETEYWLLLCKYSKNYPDPGKLLADIGSIRRILGKIIATTKRKS